MNAEDSQLPNEMGPDEQSLGQIRDILFGQQKRDLDVRIQDLHDQLFGAIGSLRSLLTERADALNSRLDDELRTLRDDLNNYRKEDRERSDLLDSKVNDAANDLRQQVGAFRETLAVIENGVRSDMQRGFEELKQSLAAQMTQVREQTQQELRRLSSNTVSRRSLSDVLRQISTQIGEG